MTKNKSPTSTLYNRNPWENNENDIWLTSKIALFRNIDKFNFPAKLNSEKQKALIPLISEHLCHSTFLEKATLIKTEDLDPLDKEFFSEHFLSSSGYYQAHGGEAFIIDASAQFLSTINIHDHIHLIMIDNELEESWNKLLNIEAALGKSLKFAFSSRFGFLTADPTLCGTGLQATVYLQLPALIHSEKIDDVLEATLDESVMVTGLHGSPTEVIGDILAIRNNYTLGISEENIIKTINRVSTKLAVEESTERSRIKASHDHEIMDRVSRAFGILNHSYQIEAVESLNALSLVKLGLACGWITGISLADLNALFFNCRRAHLIWNQENEVSKEELLHKRAEYIHQKLKNVTLTVS